MNMSSALPEGQQSIHRILSTILRHDRKQNGYKIALIRAINDVALSYSFVSADRHLAIPLRVLAHRWIA